MVAESIVCMRKLMLSMMAPCAQDGMTALVHANHFAHDWHEEAKADVVDV